MDQGELFPPEPKRRWTVRPLFDGVTFDPELDTTRLATQLVRVLALMADGQWRTLAQIHTLVGGTEAAVSARLRDLRKARFGGHTVNRRRYYDGSGLFEYQLVIAPPHAIDCDLDADCQCGRTP